ncbi:MAG: hypothetical protein FJ404_10050 [Verrucomicrobia bacterium]|nr:hypothetical protein [Verrucomicrobiota bacterium]
MSDRAMTPSTTTPLPRVLPVAHPLDDFYARAGLALPPIEPIEPMRIPEPARSLLVHDADMTPTLEAFHGGEVELSVLGREIRGETYFREVVLRLKDSGKPVEFGAIKIYLNFFSTEARRLILEERLPLGHILRQCAVPHQSRPKAFLQVTSDEVINQALGLSGAVTLYGRRNTHWDPQQRPLSEIVEILPPVIFPRT